jgi:membrane associated rhomboid family serine protease
VASSARPSRVSNRGPGDPWFQIGTVDVTTSLLIPLLTVVIWIGYAISPSIITTIWLSRDVYQQGFVWQILTWPIAEAPSLGGAIGLFFFWSFGRALEQTLGPTRYLRMLVLDTIAISILALAFDFIRYGNGKSSSAILSGLSLLALGVAVCVAVEFPGMQAFFGIPIRFLVAGFVAINALQIISVRDWLQLIYLALAIAVCVVMLRAFGMGTDLPSWVPRVPLPASWTGLQPSTRSSSGKVGGGAASKLKNRAKRSGSGSVVTGPWGEQGTGTASPSAAPASVRSSAMTKADREEVDRLLDKIAQEGMGSLSSDEKARLEDASRRLRDTDNR